MVSRVATGPKKYPDRRVMNGLAEALGSGGPGSALNSDGCEARFWAEHETYPPLEAAARFHHRLVQIHCFPNGYGRHASIAADVYLLECFTHPPIDWAGGFDLMQSNERRDEYIAALRAADAWDYAPLLGFVGAR